ncbi:DUF3248 domain-containing protein [Deinococcus yavapaiensis]|uniref:Uncharacterized protein DUF3248 n=1 Tax=Deinococcus yavapaiensis KR-236 TaxID=694435 RepID=A0A318S568_9DEIO|nr:DUF3248 domain-containing protein [Deinococcus yavapaiensis]PYE48703.1 uncharacterized protein DUF3248 [Deinococcus yavapaiensis KR-236]
MIDTPPPDDLAEQLESLGGHLVWRLGKHEGRDEVVVRVGFASATPRFAHLPKLHSASEAELKDALASGTIVIEWVG